MGMKKGERLRFKAKVGSSNPEPVPPVPAAAAPAPNIVIQPVFTNNFQPSVSVSPHMDAARTLMKTDPFAVCEPIGQLKSLEKTVEGKVDGLKTLLMKMLRGQVTIRDELRDT